MCCYGKKQFGRMVCCTIGLVCGWVTRSDGIWEQKKKTYELSERKVSKQDILKLPTAHSIKAHVTSEFMGKTFQAAQLTHERFLTIDHSFKIFF